MTSTPRQSPSLPVSIAVLPSRGLPLTIGANSDELAWLAEQAEARSVGRFEAEITVSRWHRDGVKLTGKLHAELLQTCIVTLEPVESRIEDTIERTFVPAGSKLAKPRLNAEGEWLLEAEGADPPDVLEGDTLDVWNVLLEHFLLAVEPFPRVAGAVFAQPGDTVAGEDEKPSPFAVLNQFKQPE